MIERDPRNRNWRLVCHMCSTKYPMNSAQVPDCCQKPRVHIHNTDKPCVLCKEDLITIKLSPSKAAEYLAWLRRANDICEGEGVGPDLDEVIDIFEKALKEKS